MDFGGAGTLLLGFCVSCLIFLFMVVEKKKRKVLPPGPTPLPFLGNVLQLKMTEMPQSLLKIAKVHGDVFTIHLGTKSVVVLHGYDAVNEALVDNTNVFSVRGKIPAAEFLFKGYGVIFSNGERWKQLRRFSLTTMRNFGMGKRSIEERIQEEARCLGEELMKKSGEPVDPAYLLSLAVSNVICSIVFGERFKYEDEKFLGLLRMMEECNTVMNSFLGQVFIAFAKPLRHLPGPHKKVLNIVNTIKAFIKEKVKEHQETLDKDSPRDYIDCFLIKMEEEKENPSTEFHFENLYATVLHLFIAGTETTTTTLRNSLNILLKYPNISAKVQEEIDAVVGQNRCPSVADRDMMPYTNAVIHEIQRFADIAPMGVPHAAAETTTFRGYTIPQDTTLFLLLTSVLKDPKYFPNPDSFDPSRFLDENGRFRKNEAFIPFSAGRRICLGEGLARMEIFLFLTFIVQNFHLKSDEDPSDIDLSPLPNSNGGVPRPYKIRFVPR